MHIGRVELISVSARFLSQVKSGTRILNQTIAFFAVIRKHADANTGARKELLLVQLKGAIQVFPDAANDFYDVFRPFDMSQHNGQITTEACYCIALADTRPYA